MYVELKILENREKKRKKGVIGQSAKQLNSGLFNIDYDTYDLVILNNESKTKTQIIIEFILNKIQTKQKHKKNN